MKIHISQSLRTHQWWDCVTKSLHPWGQNPELRLQHLRNHDTVLTVLSEEVAPDEENGQKYIITRKRTRIPALRVVSCQCCRNPKRPRPSAGSVNRLKPSLGHYCTQIGAGGGWILFPPHYIKKAFWQWNTHQKKVQACQNIALSLSLEYLLFGYLLEDSKNCKFLRSF